MIEFHRNQKSDSAPNLDFAIKVLGIGGAGSNILNRISGDGIEQERLVVLNTDVRALNTSAAGAKIQLGKNLTRGFGCGGDPEMGRDAALEAEAEIRAAVKGVGMIFLCAGLGGGTGSGATPVVARIAKEEGAFVVASVTIPFHFEGRRRLQQARKSLEELKTHAGALLTFENDRMGDLIVPSDGIDQAFSASDKTICQSIRAITSLVEQPGIIRVGMADVLAVLNGRNARVLFGFGRASGEDRAKKALAEALANPLLERGELLTSASSVLVQISGGSTVTLSEVEAIMNQVNEHLDEDTRLLFGVSTAQDLEDNLCVAIISSVDRESQTSAEEPLAASAPSHPQGSSQIRPLDPPARVFEQPNTAAAQQPATQRPAAQTQPAPTPKVNVRPLTPQVPDHPKPSGPKIQAQPTLPVRTPAQVKTGSVQETAQPFVAPLTPLTPLTPPPAPPPQPTRQLINPAYLQDGDEDVPAIHRNKPNEIPASLPQPPVSPPHGDYQPPVAKKAPSIFKIAENQGIESAIPKAPVQPAAQPKVRIAFSDEDAGDGRGPSSGTPTITLQQPSPSVAGRSPVTTAPRFGQNPVNLDPRARGRFAKAQPTIVNGQDLDVPTFLRKQR